MSLVEIGRYPTMSRGRSEEIRVSGTDFPVEGPPLPPIPGSEPVSADEAAIPSREKPTAITATNLKQVLEDKTSYYESRLSELRDSLSEVSEDAKIFRSNFLRTVAVDIALDLTTLARVRLQSSGSQYFTGMVDTFIWFLKDLQQLLRLFAASEGSGYLV